jgi:2,5-furandicarboxylate decarboxylase 1
MSTDQSFRAFLTVLERDHPSELLTIDEPISPKYRIQALVSELERRGRMPALRFPRVEGASMPVVTNFFASRSRLALALGLPVDKLAQEVGSRSRNFVKPVATAEAPFQEVSVTGDAVDLFKLPLITHYPVDAAPYITGGLVCARHPDTGLETAGFHRIMVKGRNRCGISLHSRRRMWEFQRRAEELGKPLEVAVLLGFPMAVYLGALAYHLPSDIGKYSVMGGLLGEPLRVTQCKSVDVAVPAGVEIVLEGKILPGVREPEGPFGEWTGYSSSRSTNNVVEFTRVSHRKQPIYVDIAGGLTSDHVAPIALIREDEIMRALKRTLPNVRQVHVPASGAAGLTCYISMKKTVEGQPKQAFITALSVEYYLKFIVVVDEDIDIFNEREVAWAVYTRSSAEKMTLLPGGMGAVLDPMSDPQTNTITKIGIDATLPLGGKVAERLRLPEEIVRWASEVLARHT